MEEGEAGARPRLMRDLLITLIVFGAVPWIIQRPHIGILVWSWLAYMNPHRMSWGFAYNLPFSAVTALAIFVGFLVNKEPKRIPVNGLTIVWGLFVFWMIVTTIFAVHPDFALVEMKKTMKIQLMTLMTLLLMAKRERIEQLVWVIAFSIGYFGIKGGVFTILTAGQYRVWGPPETFIEGNNEIALALIIIMPLMRYLQQRVENVWLSRAIIGSMVLSGFSILASYSRGALLAGTAMVLSLWWKGRNRFSVALVIFLLAVSIYPFVPEKWTSRMETINTYEEDASAMGRINAWHFAWNLASDRPLTGGGFQAFTEQMFLIYAPDPFDYHDAHSIYFEVLGEQGFVGLVLFLTIWFLTHRTGTWIIRRTQARPELAWAHDLAAMLQVSLVGYLVGGAFLGLAYFDLPYHIMALMLLTRAEVEKVIGKDSGPTAHSSGQQL